TRSSTTTDCADSVRRSPAFISLAKEFPGPRHFLSAELARTDHRPAGKCISSRGCSLFPNASVAASIFEAPSPPTIVIALPFSKRATLLEQTKEYSRILQSNSRYCASRVWWG